MFCLLPSVLLRLKNPPSVTHRWHVGLKGITFIKPNYRNLMYETYIVTSHHVLTLSIGYPIRLELFSIFIDNVASRQKLSWARLPPGIYSFWWEHRDTFNYYAPLEQHSREQNQWTKSINTNCVPATILAPKI